ncbi:MAG: hypothetical protein WBD73_01160, partial [Candidatus Acidiferrales bacterium]
SVLLVLSMLNVVGYQPTERNNSDSEIRKAKLLLRQVTGTHGNRTGTATSEYRRKPFCKTQGRARRFNNIEFLE